MAFPDDIQKWSDLCGATAVRELFWLPETDSTNNEAKKILAKNDICTNLPFLCVSREQTGGRGRADHAWWSPAGGLYLTLAARWAGFSLTRDQSVELSLRTARAVAETLTEELANSGTEITIHPPNDVYASGRKIAGILIESPRPEFVIVGIGVNGNNSSADAPPELREKIVSLLDLTGGEIELPRFAAALLRRLIPSTSDNSPNNNQNEHPPEKN